MANTISLAGVSDDAVTVVLAGRLTGESCSGLRAVLLRTRPRGVPDVHLDASAVTAVDDAVFAVLLAASAWLRATGGQLWFSATSATVRHALAELAIANLLPTLPAQGAAAVDLPRPRGSVEMAVSARVPSGA